MSRMKITQKMELTLYHSITAEEQPVAAGQAETLVRLAINAHLAVIAQQPHFLISSAKGMSV